VQDSGTTCRLMTAIFAAGKGLFRISGSGRMHKRPIGDLCNALTRLGAGIAYTEDKGCPPFLLQANGLDPDLVKGELSIGMDASSQYFSGLLMAAPLSKKELVLELGGQKAISWPYIGLTLQCLNDFGIPFTVETRSDATAAWKSLEAGRFRDIAMVVPGCLRISVQPGTYNAGCFEIEGDWSGASYFLAAGALGKKPVCVRGLREDSLQGDRLLLDILSKMGGAFESETNAVTVYPSSLHGVDLDMGSVPDLVPTVAVLASFAQGSTRIHNVAHLKLKESDRIKTTAQELRKFGVIIDMLSDGLLITGQGDHVKFNMVQSEQTLHCHNDHRLAMALAIIDMVIPEAHVYEHMDDPNCVTKSFPTFWELWKHVLAESGSVK
ncbi:MAG: 3-phosphoshikimate 1-carboxyvinyltransferase, partial [Desulfovibrio sp.]|nr:3-phosphoshikimate 1-carboxyvinyltransferase [Desulfovibrio sp.]